MFISVNVPDVVSVDAARPVELLQKRIQQIPIALSGFGFAGI